MTIITKISGATLSLGLVDGVAYTANYFFSGESLGKALELKAYELMNFDIENRENWTAIIKDYLSSNNKLNNLKINLADSTSPTNEQIKKLKDECQKVLSLKKYEQSILSSAEKFCVTPITIKALLEKQKYTILDTDSNDLKNNTEWDKKVSDYLKNTNQNTLSGINLSSLSPSDQKGKRNELRKGCKVLEEKKTHSPSFHLDYAKFKEWCSIKTVSKDS